MKIAQARILMQRFKIRDKATGREMPFVLNQTQKLILDKLQELDEQSKPLWVICLKARQLGVSTLIEALLICHCLSEPSASVSIVAHDFKSARELFLCAKRMKDSLPMELPPGTQHVLEFPHSGSQVSRLKVATAGKGSSGRGQFHTALHLSEVGHYVDDNAFLSLLPTVNYSPGSILILESTANGREGLGAAFYDYWNAAVDGRNDFLPIFIPWTYDKNYVRDPELAADAPIDEDEEELIKAGVTLAQLAWRRVTIETKCKGDVSFFEQEFPLTAEQSFMASGDPAFTKEELQRGRASIQKPILRGNIVPVPGSNASEAYFEPNSKTGFHFWQQPKPKLHYYIGADPARGVEDGDFAAICIWEGETGEQAASYSEKINPSVLADVLNAVGRYYNRAMLNIELTGNSGIETQRILRDVYHYPNLYRWKGRDDKEASRRGMSFGWETQFRSREMMFVSFREAVRSGVCLVRDERICAQMERATRSENYRWVVERGHDDLMMAALIGWIARVQYPPPNVHGPRVPILETKINRLGGREVFSDLQFELQKHHRQVFRSKKKTLSVG